MKAGSLALLCPAIVLAGVTLAAAQQPRAGRLPPPRPAPMPPTPVPPPHTAPLPPSPAALTVPNPLAGLRPGPRDLYRLPDGSDRFHHLSPYAAQPTLIVPGLYFPGYYSPNDFPGPYDAVMPVTNSVRRHQVVDRGRLVLQTIPDTAQVYVDGYYAGLAEEFGLSGKAMDIAAGAHRIELRAPGYETFAFSVMIEPNDTVRYRGDMQPLSIQPATAHIPPPAAPAPTKSLYVIPNCYAGDKPPSGTLPKGCDPKKLQTRK